MNVQIVGTMLDPSGGEPAGGAMIQFIALAQYGGVPKGAQSTQTTSATGEYDFPLNYGRYTLAINHSGRFVNQAVSVTVNEDSPSVMDIDLLLESSVPLTPPEIKYVEELVEQAEQAALSSSNSASQAGVEVINATNQANIATNEADRAKSEADRATEVTGLDTVEEAVDLALGEFAGMMDESEARAIQMLHLERFDASGMVHMGKSLSSGSINEGLCADGGALRMGRQHSAQFGTSKTDFAVTHIAGAVSNITGASQYFRDWGLDFHLPEAEDGTRIYDSTGDCRGSGQASLDLKVDVDPKYGDVPTGTESQILREAVGRAFEGSCKNGDFRLGDNGDWVEASSGTGSMTIDNGSCAIIGIDAANRGRITATISNLVVGDDYLVTYHADAVSGTLNITGLPQGSVINLGGGVHTIFITANATTNFFTWESSAGGSDITISNVSLQKVTEEVVTHPVDLVGLEYYEEELTGRQEVFECIQSLGTTFGTTGVPTVLSTRKLSYFQQYDGQFPEVTANPDFINDRYRCVVWDELSEPDKRKIAAYMKERLFMGVNKKPVNGRLRGRTIRGLKNGDWRNTDASGNATGVSGDTTRLVRHAVGTGKYVKPQGNRDVVPADTDGHPIYDANKTYPAYSDGGVFSAYKSSSVADDCSYQGRCFMYVVATVPRANKGAYHPLNEYGTNKLTSDGSDYKFWYELSEADRPKTVLECFTKARVNTGAINQVSGHPDGIFYDGIEAGGLNGVIDWRLGAVANYSPEEAAKVEAKVENGTYRGFEKLVHTRAGSTVATSGTPSSAVPNHNAVTGGRTAFEVQAGKPYFVVNADTNDVATVDSQAALDANRVGNLYYPSAWGKPSIVYTVNAMDINLSVSGEFNTKMVIGDPANILLTDALKDGWLGTWCTVIPDGTGVVGQFPLTRQALGSNTTPAQSTIDNGVTWSTTNLSTDYTKNEVGVIQSANRLLVVPYKAFANQVKKSTNKPVLNATKGLLGVTVTQSHDKAVLAEAVAGVILKSDASGIVTERSNPVKFLVNEVIERITSLATDMVAPTNGSQAIKIAVYQISENGQVSLGFIANTMTHNGTDWGELDEIIIPFGDLEVDTFNDANGILQTAQSTMTAIPHGWTSNHARAGAQVPGVDL